MFYFSFHVTRHIEAPCWNIYLQVYARLPFIPRIAQLHSLFTQRSLPHSNKSNNDLYTYWGIPHEFPTLINVDWCMYINTTNSSYSKRVAKLNKQRKFPLMKQEIQFKFIMNWSWSQTSNRSKCKLFLGDLKTQANKNSCWLNTNEYKVKILKITKYT